MQICSRKYLFKPPKPKARFPKRLVFFVGPPSTVSISWENRAYLLVCVAFNWKISVGIDRVINFRGSIEQRNVIIQRHFHFCNCYLVYFEECVKNALNMNRNVSGKANRVCKARFTTRDVGEK